MPYYVDLECLQIYLGDKDTVKTNGKTMTHSQTVDNLEVTFSGKKYLLTEKTYKNIAQELAKDIATKNKPNSWYAQLSVGWLPSFEESVALGKDVFYPRGHAKMKIVPKIDDNVQVLLKKNIIYEGKVVDKDFLGYYLKLKAVSPPVFIGKFYRRNWVLSSLKSRR